MRVTRLWVSDEDAEITVRLPHYGYPVTLPANRRGGGSLGPVPPAQAALRSARSILPQHRRRNVLFPPLAAHRERRRDLTDERAGPITSESR